MHTPRWLQRTFIFLLFGLIVLGTGLASADPVSFPEAGQVSMETYEENSLWKQRATDLFCNLKRRINQTWNEGNLDLIFTTYAWHNRLTYDSDRVERYNENAWGGGLGLSMFDEDGDTHMLFLVGFRDSWKKFEPYGGYGFLKNWYFGDKRNFRAGAGFSLGITARHEYDYIPLPLPLPLVSVGYKRLSLEAAYIPGTLDNGNVLFTWVRWTFG